MEWSHNDTWLLSADHSGCVKYWQSNMNNVKTLQAHTDPVRGVGYVCCIFFNYTPQQVRMVVLFMISSKRPNKTNYQN